MSKIPKSERKRLHMEKMGYLVENCDTLILVESSEDASFIKGLISRRYNVSNNGVINIYESGSRRQVQDDLKILRTQLTAPNIQVKRILCIIDGDNKDSSQAFQECINQIENETLRNNTHFYQVQGSEQNGFSDLETLVISITKKDYNNAVNIRDLFLSEAQKHFDLSYKKSKREIAVWMACLPDFDGYLDQVLFHNIDTYVDLEHSNLSQLYQVLDSFFRNTERQ